MSMFMYVFNFNVVGRNRSIDLVCFTFSEILYFKRIIEDNNSNNSNR